MLRRLPLLGVALALCACGSLPVKVGVKPARGFLWTHYRAPMQTDFHATELGSKHGEATVWYLHDAFWTGSSMAWGDASIAEAALDGEIGTVRHTDYELLNIAGVLVRFRVHAYGD
jgi:hypothetical protein